MRGFRSSQAHSAGRPDRSLSISIAAGPAGEHSGAGAAGLVGDGALAATAGPEIQISGAERPGCRLRCTVVHWLRRAQPEYQNLEQYK